MERCSLLLLWYLLGGVIPSIYISKRLTHSFGIMNTDTSNPTITCMTCININIIQHKKLISLVVLVLNNTYEYNFYRRDDLALTYRYLVSLDTYNSKFYRMIQAILLCDTCKSPNVTTTNLLLYNIYNYYLPPTKRRRWRHIYPC